ncbi:MAG: heavy metal-associated domain-containing protein [Clostridia bacterium]|nr:heavy metal-associated domain-containing protein [Clostridia bacterium]
MLIVKIEGMGCARCVTRVTDALKTLGLSEFSVELGSATIERCDDVEAVRSAIESLGFEVTSIEGN